MFSGGGSVLLAGAVLCWSTTTANTLISSAHAQFTTSSSGTSTGARSSTSNVPRNGVSQNEHPNHHTTNRHHIDGDTQKAIELPLPLPLSVRLAALGAACHTAALAVRQSLSYYVYFTFQYIHSYTY